MKISPQQFFLDFFPKAYVCAMRQGGGQFEGRLMDDETKLGKNLKDYAELNKSHYNIYFTPNGGKTAEGRNSLSNLAKINSWWIDIDIDSCKHADDEETQILRERRKEELRGHIFGWAPLPVWPSLTIETRNGYQLYWFADAEASVDNWMTIGQSIFEHYKNIKTLQKPNIRIDAWTGADRSTVKLMQLMRLPNFWYFKNGEKGKIQIEPCLSTLRKYSEAEMLQSFPPVAQEITPLDLRIKPQVYKPKYQTTVDNSDDIFSFVVSLPLDEVLAKLSGHWLVNGEVLTLQKIDTRKSNILVDGRVTPNFIDRAENHIYSNNAVKKGPTIIQYLEWYQGERKSKIAAGLHELFTFKK